MIQRMIIRMVRRLAFHVLYKRHVVDYGDGRKVNYGYVRRDAS